MIRKTAYSLLDTFAPQIRLVLGRKSLDDSSLPLVSAMGEYR